MTGPTGYTGYTGAAGATLSFIIDGGGVPLTTGIKGDLHRFLSAALSLLMTAAR